MTPEQFNYITAWQKETFPQANELSKAHHLLQEVQELIQEIQDEDHTIDFEKRRNVHMEYADCFLLLFGSAAAYGMSYNDILKAIDAKMKINKARKWGKPDDNGVVNHIK